MAFVPPVMPCSNLPVRRPACLLHVRKLVTCEAGGLPVSQTSELKRFRVSRTSSGDKRVDESNTSDGQEELDPVLNDEFSRQLCRLVRCTVHTTVTTP